MDRRKQPRAVRHDRIVEYAAALGDLEMRIDQRLGRRGSERHDDARPDDVQLQIEPWPAGADVAGVRPLVKAPLAAWAPPEMFDDIRHEDLLAVDSGGLERFIEDPTGRADEDVTLTVLLIPWLLPDEGQSGPRRTLTEDRLRGVFPELARPAVASRGSDRRDSGTCRDELSGVNRGVFHRESMECDRDRTGRACGSPHVGTIAVLVGEPGLEPGTSGI
jgi:hypothetical protein